MAAIAFRILGPLEVAGVKARDLLPGVKPRQALATLLLHPNQFVSTDLIADALWEAAPPRSAAANMRTYIRMLRECIDRAGVRSHIDTHVAGYQLVVSPDDVDLSYTETLIAEGRHLVASGDPAGGLALLDRACGLWRGAPLEDLPLCSSWQDSLSRLEHQRATLIDEVIPLHVRFGDPYRAVELARDALVRDPYSEDLWCHVVVSLRETGQIAAARQAVADCRGILAQQLGTDIGPRLLALEASLTEDTRAPASAPPILVTHRSAVPHQLPPDVAGFIGRAGEIEYLSDIICSPLRNRPPVAVVSGPPGAGKSALVVHTAHRVLEQFPDGQLFLDLRGGTRPRHPAEALGEMLLGLGLPESAIPHAQDRRAAALRSELASRRVLIVLDDAVSAEQVAPLLPGTGSSAMLVTSRRGLADLSSALHLRLDVMDSEEAYWLLAGIVGEHRTAADQAAAQAIIEACGHLPLAIRVAATRLAHRPDLTLDRLAQRLRDSGQVLDELSSGTGGLRASADLSYRMLSPDQARGYRLLGMLGSGDCPTWTFQALTDASTSDRMIDGLAQAHLIDLTSEPSTGHCAMRMHDLLRLHARELAGGYDDASEDLRLVVRHWTARTNQAVKALRYQYFGIEPPNPPTDVAGLDSPISAEWFDVERRGLLPTLRAAVEHGLEEEAWPLAAGWAAYFDLRGDYALWMDAHLSVLPALSGTQQLLGRGVLLRDLGQIALYRDELDVAAQHFAASLELFEKLDHHNGIGVARIGLGTVHRVKGHDDAALEQYTNALETFIAISDRRGETVARNAIASIWLGRGDLDQAEVWLNRALALAIEVGDVHRQAQVRRRFAVLRRERGQFDLAQAELDAALQTFDTLGDQHCSSYVRTALGELCIERGDLLRAQRLFIDALSVGRQLGDITTQARAYRWLGEVSLRAGRTTAARRYLTTAVRSWQLGSNPAEAKRVQVLLNNLGGDAGPM